MIRNFKDKSLKDQFEKGGKRFGAQSAKLDDLMDVLDGAIDTHDLGGLKHIHALKGNKKGTFAVNVTKNMRLTFRFRNGDAFDVNYEDYH